MQPRHWISAGAALAALGVALGAFGAHGLHDRLTASDQLANWQTAVRYQMWHALALVALGLWCERRTPPRSARAAGWAWMVGAVLFSGSLYGLCLDGPGAVLGPITPIGGVGLLVGWALFGVAARGARSQPAEAGR